MCLLQAGHQAQQVAHIGKAGSKDWNVARHAAEGDFVVVTNNASDFRRLYAMRPLHAGLVINVPSVRRVQQQPLFRGAHDELAQIGEPFNRVLEVDIEGDEATFRVYEFPAADDEAVSSTDVEGSDRDDGGDRNRGPRGQTDSISLVAS